MDGGSLIAIDPAALALAAPAKPKRKEWTNREEKILREHFQTGGAPACLEHLPDRTESSIYQHANAMGLRSEKQTKERQRWTTNEHIDAVIRRVYQSDKLHTGVVTKLAKTLGRPTWWVKKRAAALGHATPRFKEPKWSSEETELLEANAYKSPDRIRLIFKKRGFTRTTTAIVVKMKRLECDRTDLDHYTATALSNLFGIDAKVVTGWIAKGWLKAKRRGTDRVNIQGGDMWWIHRKDIRTFVIDNVAAVDFRKVDKFWLTDLLCMQLGEKMAESTRKYKARKRKEQMDVQHA